MPLVVRSTRGRSVGHARQLAQPVHPRARAVDDDARAAPSCTCAGQEVAHPHAVDAVAAPRTTSSTSQ